MTILETFLVGLARDPERLCSFISNPENFMATCGLEPKDRELVVSGDPARIYADLHRLFQTGPAGDAALPGFFHYQKPPNRAAADLFNEHMVVVGTGIRSIGQMTTEAIAWIKKADRVPYLVNDPVAVALIRELNPKGAEPLHRFYAANKDRRQTYEEVVEHVLGYVKAGDVVCFTVYGHPGVFAFPTHESIRRARAAGFRARMLAGVSAEDCLFADLGIDPSTSGCQSYEATDFLINGRIIDPTSHVVLWQIGVLGDLTHQAGGYMPRGLPYLMAMLSRSYPPQHPATIYEAPLFPGIEASIQTFPLWRLPEQPTSVISTLYLPPAGPPRANLELYQMLGIR